MSMFPPPPTGINEQHYVSQFSTDTVGIQTYLTGALHDADGNTVTCVMRDASNNVIFTRAATHVSLGTYTITFLSSDVAVPGSYTLTWTYTVNGTQDTFTTYINVGSTSPAYDALDPTFKTIIESVWARFGDLFDSPNGGPHLQAYFQTHMNRGRLAQLLHIAVGKLNTVGQPYMTYSLDMTMNPFPITQWGALLEQTLYMETLKHLVRSYTEQPTSVGVNVAMQDRTNYAEKWRAIYDMEYPEYKEQYDHFKISNMGFGRARVLVGGGVYGQYGPTRLPGSAVARPRYWARFF